MTAIAKLLENIRHEVIGHKKVKSPGPAFDLLCALFPLKAIGGKREHGMAVEVAAKVTEYLISSGDRPAELRMQLSAYLEALGVLVEKYEREHFPMAGKRVSGAEMLKQLMEENGINQMGLKKELGGQSIVSAVLAGKRKLNARQIAALAGRFHVSPSIFFDS